MHKCVKEIILILTLVLSFCITKPASALNTENFYFDSYDADYYLTKTEDSSKLKIVETFTAVFPDYNQNKGICRMIPYLSNGNKNRTLTDLNESKIKLTRNGIAKPIYSIDEEDGYYKVCTGTEKYLTGIQKYTFEYNFERVITNQQANDKSWQELYWNTNGNGWNQYFNSATVRLHIQDPTMLTGEAACYKGKYGSNEKCNFSFSEDKKTITFSTGILYGKENMTFVVGFKPESFSVPDPEKNYIAIIITSSIILLLIISLIRTIIKYFKLKPLHDFYKGLFVKPEYKPDDKYTLSELSAAYIGEQKNIKVALILQMIIDKKISLKKEKNKWSIIVNNYLNLLEEEKIILKILNNGKDFKNVEEIKIKRQSATRETVNLAKDFEKEIFKGAIDKKIITSASASNVSNKISTIFLSIVCAIIPIITIISLSDMPEEEHFLKGELVVGYHLCVRLAIIIASILIAIIKNLKCYGIQDFEYRTEKGLEVSRFMDGLKLYIQMAEKDRIEFLQSVKGADTTPKGIVKLYEKLLPYAALFGLEKSWMKELSKYCEVNEIERPEWYAYNMYATSELLRTINNASTIIDSSSYMGSSGSSGLGGGGFSGGGGGGGGGCGR